MDEYKCLCGKIYDNKMSLGAHKTKCKAYQLEKQKQLKILKIEEDSYNCICNCGRKFKTLKSLNSHARFCDQYIKKDKHNKYIKKDKHNKYFNQDTSTYICECGYETENYQSLNGHFSHCKKHRQMNNKDCSDEYWNKRNHVGKMSGWDKFTNEEKKEICKKGSITIKEKHDRGENVSYYKGHKQSEETKEKIRRARYNYLSDKKQHGAFINGKHSYIEEQFISIINENKLYENFDIVEEYAHYPYFLDFALPNLKIDIELDGKFHQYEQNKIHDQKRTEKLNSEGWHVIRYTYDDIINNKDFQQNILNLFSSLNDINHHINSKIYTYQEYKQLISQ